MSSNEALDEQQALDLAELIATDTEAFAALMADQSDSALGYVIHGLAVTLIAQRRDLELFASATRVVGAMVNGLMDAEMADGADELLHKLHAAGHRERRRFLAATE